MIVHPPTPIVPKAADNRTERLSHEDYERLIALKVDEARADGTGYSLKNVSDADVEAFLRSPGG